MKEIVLNDNPTKKRIYIENTEPDFSKIPKKDIDLFVSLLGNKMYEHFKNRRKHKSRDSPRNV